MKAIYFPEHGSIDVLRYGDVDDPQVQPGWVKVAVTACSLNYLDIFSRRGMPGIRIALPGITGGDCAGTVAELGDGVSGWEIGRRVLVNPAHIDDTSGHFEMMGETRPGAMADYCVCRADQLIPIPDGVSDEDAAALPVAYATAYRMLFTKGALKAGERVLILGASGGVGTACVLLAKMAGATVIAAAGSDEKCRRLEALGADETLNYSEEGVDTYAKRTTGSLFRGGGYDPKTDIRFIFMAEMAILGSTGFSREDIEACLKLVEDGTLKPEIDAVFPLSQGIEAIRRIEDRAVFGKIIVKPDAA